MRQVFITLALAASTLLFAQTATGQPPPPTLTGEFLSSLTAASITSGNCDPAGNSSSTFEISGVAAGPYPGTFTETGSVTIGPQIEEFVPGQFRGPITVFQAHFLITSAVGTVEGDKTLVLDSPANVGVCIGLSGVLQAEQVIASDLTYTATITTTDGTFTDRGSTFANFNAYQPPPPTNTQAEFREGFTSDLLTPEPGGGNPPATVVVLTPPSAFNPVGTQHTVTATATTSTGSPAGGTTILFTVSGASSTQGTCTTNQQGQCTFTYTGPELPGVDLITGCADNDNNGATDPGEPCGEATKFWILPATAPGQVTGGGWIVFAGDRVNFGFNAQSDGPGTARGNCNLIDHGTGAHIKCQTVDSLVVTPTHATFFGQATIDGVGTNYRIDVDDLGEPGTSDTFKIQTDSGYLAAGTLQGGNIQIHE
jgi:hypothetical protein